MRKRTPITHAQLGAILNMAPSRVTQLFATQKRKAPRRGQRAPKSARVRGLRFLGDHRAREGKGAWGRFYTWRSRTLKAIVFRRDERPRKHALRVVRAPRGKGARAHRKTIRRYLLGAAVTMAGFWYFMRRAS